MYREKRVLLVYIDFQDFFAMLQLVRQSFILYTHSPHVTHNTNTYNACTIIYISRPPLSLARTLLRTARRVSQGILRGKKKKTITRAFFNTHEECAAAGEYYNIEFRHFTHTRVSVSYLRREREREREQEFKVDIRESARAFCPSAAA